MTVEFYILYTVHLSIPVQFLLLKEGTQKATPLHGIPSHQGAAALLQLSVSTVQSAKPRRVPGTRVQGIAHASSVGWAGTPKEKIVKLKKSVCLSLVLKHAVRLGRRILALKATLPKWQTSMTYKSKKGT